MLIKKIKLWIIQIIVLIKIYKNIKRKERLQMKIKNLHIKEYNGLENLDINFESKGKVLDLIVLAGINGSGKTRVLESVLDFFYKIEMFYKSQNKIELFYEEIENESIKTAGNIDVFYNELKNGAKGAFLSPKYLEIKKILKKFPKIIYVPTEINFQKVQKAQTNFKKEYNFINIVDSYEIKDIPSYIATRISKVANEEEDLTMGLLKFWSWM